MVRFPTVCILVLLSQTTMAGEIFIHSHHPVSNRFAIFEDNEKVAYLYLTRPGTQRPEKDAVAYSRQPLVPEINWKAIRETGDAPPLSQHGASPQAVIPDPREQEFSFKWSSDGKAVALLRNGMPIAFAAVSERFGYSKAVSKASPLAIPWDQKRYEAIFGK